MQITVTTKKQPPKPSNILLVSSSDSPIFYYYLNETDSEQEKGKLMLFQPQVSKMFNYQSHHSCHRDYPNYQESIEELTESIQKEFISGVRIMGYEPLYEECACQENREEIRKLLKSTMEMLRKKQRFLTNIVIYRYERAGMEVLIPQVIKEGQWRFLQLLSLEDNNIGSKGISILVKQSYLYLEWLDLSHNPLRNEGVKLVSKGNWLRLLRLILRDVRMTKHSLKYLKKLAQKSEVFVSLSQGNIPIYEVKQLPMMSFSVVSLSSWRRQEMILKNIVVKHQHFNDLCKIISEEMSQVSRLCKEEDESTEEETQCQQKDLLEHIYRSKVKASSFQ